MHILTRQSIIKGTCPKCAGIDQAFFDPDAAASCIRKVCFQCGHSDYFSPHGFPLEAAIYGEPHASVKIQRETRPRSAENFHAETLTPRQRMIVGLVADGQTNAQICKELSLSKTVLKLNVSWLNDQMDASSRTDLTRKARALLQSA